MVKFALDPGLGLALGRAALAAWYLAALQSDATRTRAMKRSAEEAKLDEEDKMCPICYENWDVNGCLNLRLCCMKRICEDCDEKVESCPLCRTPKPETNEEALAILRRHVEKDHPAAIYHLGSSYLRGEFGLMPSPKKAARLFQRAADLDDATAMLNLGYAYEHGHGVKLDKKKAVKYYRMAADRGDASAQAHLGNCFENGKGVPQDDAEAVRFWKLAADQGFTNAEYAMGCAYVTGRGVARDLAEAKRWFERATAKGDEDAKAALALLRKR